jgi:hypothetical protein
MLIALFSLSNKFEFADRALRGNSFRAEMEAASLFVGSEHPRDPPKAELRIKADTDRIIGKIGHF